MDTQLGIVVVGVVGIAGATIVAYRSLMREDNGGDVADLFEFLLRANALRIATVFAVLFVTAYLAVDDKLNEAACAILSGVAGFVLGGIRSENEHASEGDDSSSDDEGKGKE